MAARFYSALVRGSIAAFLQAIFVGTLAAQNVYGPLDPGTFPDTWERKNLDCATDPEFQVHAYTQEFYILRQSRCINIQKPFLYLILGADRAILMDTGAVGDPPQHSSVAETVLELVDRWTNDQDISDYSLIVAHTHAHADHVGGDRFFENRENVTVLRLGKKAVSEFFGISDWPNTSAEFDLGGRFIDVLPIPGHDADSIAIYDRKTGVLLSGDSIMPGNIYTVAGLKTFRASNQRMIDFLADKPLSHVLGAHIDYADVPYQLMQPQWAEHKLQLGRSHLLEMQFELDRMEKKITPMRLRDFRICKSFFYGC